MTGKETIDILDRIARENNGNKVYGKAENAVAYVFAESCICVTPQDLSANRERDFSRPLMAVRMSRVAEIQVTGWGSERYLTVYIKSKEEDFFNIRIK